MGSKILWMTDLGLTKISSGELSPGLDPTELRFRPSYGWGLDEWSFEVGIISGTNPVESFTKEDFIYEGNYFKLKMQFKEFTDPSCICILAIHTRTGFKQTIWDGIVVPNKFNIKQDVVGLTYNWSVIDGIKKMYPNVNLRHFKLPTINVSIPGTAILTAIARTVEEHQPENSPIIVKGFHPYQKIDFEIAGHVIGYGGMGGDAGMSTVTDEVTIIYPTDGLDGGNPIFVEHETQDVNIHVTRHGHYQPGHGGKGASSFLINCPERRYNQLGNAGLGGYPTGRNGKYTDIHYKTKVVTDSKHADILPMPSNQCHYEFHEATITSQTLPYFLSNKCIKETKDGKCGLLKPAGVKTLKNEGEAFPITNLCYAYGIYVFF